MIEFNTCDQFHDRKERFPGASVRQKGQELRKCKWTEADAEFRLLIPYIRSDNAVYTESCVLRSNSRNVARTERKPLTEKLNHLGLDAKEIGNNILDRICRMRFLGDQPNIREHRFVFYVRTSAKPIRSKPREIEKKTGERVVSAFVSNREAILCPRPIEHGNGAMRKNIEERPKGRVTVTDPIEYQLGIMGGQNAAYARHSHEIDDHFDPIFAGLFVGGLHDLVDLTRRKVERDP